MYYLILGLLVAVALAVAILLVRKKTKMELQPTLELQNEVNRLSASEAAALAEEILQGEGWRITDALQEEVHCGPLGDQFFSRFGSVSRDAVPTVEVQLTSPRKIYVPDYLEIGTEMEEGLVVMNLKDDSVVALDRGEKVEDGMRFESIYHFLVFIHKCDESDTNVA